MKNLRPDWFDNPNIREFKKGDQFTFSTTHINIFEGYDRYLKGYIYYRKDNPNVKGIFRKTYKESQLL